MSVYFAVIRRELSAKGFSKAMIDALEGVLTTANSASSTASGSAGDITSIQGDVTALQTDVASALDLAADAALLHPFQEINPDEVVQIVQDATGLSTDVRGVGIYLLATFRNADQKLYLAGSDDGISWQWLKRAAYTAGADVLRDPSIIRHNDKYWVAHTSITSGSATTYFGLASSPDLSVWTHVTDVSMTAISGVVHVWAPEWFVDDDGPHILFTANTSASTSTGFAIYETHPTNDAMTTWSAPVALSGTLPSSIIDPFVVKIGPTYYLWFKNNPNNKLGYATSSSLTSGWVTVQDGTTDWAGFGTLVEGPSLVQIEANTWRIYFDAFTDLGYYYSESSDGFATWSARTLVTPPDGIAALSHGTVQRVTDPAYIANILGLLAQRPLSLGGGLDFTSAGLLERSALSGDVAAAAGSNSTTLATVNSNVGAFGSATQVSTFTVNGKGLITAASNVAITAPTLQTARAFSYTGDATGGPTNFNGSADVSTALTLANSGVSAGTYGGASSIPVITLDAKGRATAATTAAVAIKAYAPLVNGTTPGPVFMADPKGQCIMAPIT